MQSGDIVELKKTEVELKSYEETQIEWRIHDFVSVAESGGRIESPNFSAGDDSSLHFSLTPKSTLYPGFMSVYLCRRGSREYAVEFKSGLKTSDGSVRNFWQGTIREKLYSSNVVPTMKLSEILSNKSKLVPGDVLSIMCTLKREITHPTQTDALDARKPSQLIRLDRLSEDFQDLFRDTETCDTTLKVKNKDYKAHRSVLTARSPVFAAAFKHDTSERETGVITILDCDPNSFQKFLAYLYSGRLEELSFSDAISLYVTSDKYDVPELKEFCVEHLTQSLNMENICEIVVFADNYDEAQLLSAAKEFFMKNGFEILLTSEWKHLMKDNYRMANKLLTEFSKANLKQKDTK